MDSILSQRLLAFIGIFLIILSVVYISKYTELKKKTFEILPEFENRGDSAPVTLQNGDTLNVLWTQTGATGNANTLTFPSAEETIANVPESRKLKNYKFYFDVRNEHDTDDLKIIGGTGNTFDGFTTGTGGGASVIAKHDHVLFEVKLLNINAGHEAVLYTAL